MVTRTPKSLLEAEKETQLGTGRSANKRCRSFVEYLLRRRPGFVLLLLPILLVASLYIVSSSEDYDLEPRYPSSFYSRFNRLDGNDMPEGYLVWSSKCQMPSKNPMDPSIRSYVKKEKFQSCSDEKRRLSGLDRLENGTVLLFLDPRVSSRHPGLECCWSSVFRADPRKPGKGNVDSSIAVEKCEQLKDNVTLTGREDAVLIRCTDLGKTKTGKRRNKVYENVHPVLGIEKVQDRWGNAENRSAVENVATRLSRKLSVLLLGIDSVSRLNFLRSVPITEKHLRETGWIRVNGYNKMGDNTFPNLMAILTGQNQTQAYSVCKPTVPRKLDSCPFIWHDFHRAGYATAYGEDETSLNTFNYLKVGFVEPPTDYYLRPYMLACERLLKVKKRFGLKYCTGPEINFDRIFDYAVNFARTFLTLPYFGLFWTVGVSHENANGLSSMDERLLSKLTRLERDGVLNESMVVLLSDHGMRWGAIRNTFVGWYEERLPILYVWLPPWFRDERPDAYSSLLTNQHRLVSPFDLYETLRDVLDWSGGKSIPSVGCPTCHSLLAGPLPRTRGCSDAGVSDHWCACTAFKSADSTDPTVQKGVQAFLEHANDLVDNYRDKKGVRLCAKLRLKKLHRADRVIDFTNSTDLSTYFYLIQVSPGDGKFEVTVRQRGDGAFTVSDHEVSRINSYASAAECLGKGMKQYCHCVKR